MLRVLLLAALLFAGCATHRVERALQNEAAAYVYDRPARELWLEISAFLVENGYSVPGGQIGNALTTDWRSEGGGGVALRTRYRVEARPVEGGTALQFLLEEHRVRERMSFVAAGGPRPREPQGILSGPEPEPEAPSGVDAPSAIGPLAPATEESRQRRDLAMEWAFLERVRPRDADRLRALWSR